MKKLLLIVPLLFFIQSGLPLNCYGQQKISNLLFNSTKEITGLIFKEATRPEVFYTGQKANATIGEGIAHAEDAEGKIIFWVNSGGVFDKEHQLMPGSEGIFAHPSSTEITISPFPNNPSLYYIFYNNQLCSGLYYTVVDMSLRNGAGDVSQLNVHISPGINFAEGLEIIRVPCSKNYWLIAKECGKGFRRFTIDQAGISKDWLFGMNTSDFGGRGELDYHKGKIGYAVTFNNEAYFADFDPATGESSNYQLVKFPSLNGAYGLEFSPDGNKAYVTDLSNRDIFGNPTGSNLFSYHFTTKAIRSWSIVNDNPSCPSQMEGLGHIEMGKDGNLYISQINGCQIVVVEDPDSDQAVIRKINVNTVLSAGISDHIQTDFLDEDFIRDVEIFLSGEPFLCSGEEKVLYTNAPSENSRLHWFKDGYAVPDENGNQLKVEKPGKYTLSVSNDAGCTATSNEIIIEDRSIPPFEYQEKYSGCTGETLAFTTVAEGLEITWSNGTKGNQIPAKESGTYSFIAENGFCSTSGSVEVSLQDNGSMKIPNVITPNGDNLNEFFFISGAAEKFSLFIYNRWGSVVYHDADYRNNWNGKSLPKGSYYYKINPYSPCLEEIRGWLMIL